MTRKGQVLSIRFKVLGKPWTLKLCTKSKYMKKNGDDSLAMTWGYKRTIYLSPLAFNKETITHELWHAYLHECCTFSASLTIEAFEEICAELIAKRGREILDLADTLEFEVRMLTASKETV